MEFMTRLSMRMKWGESPTGILIETGLWECEVRNNPCNRKFGCIRTSFRGANGMKAVGCRSICPRQPTLLCIFAGFICACAVPYILSFQESVDYLFLGLRLCQAKRHQFDELISGDLAYSRFMHQSRIYVVGLEPGNCKDASLVHND